MGWSYADYLETPEPVLEQALALMEEDRKREDEVARQIEAARAKR